MGGQAEAERAGGYCSSVPVQRFVELVEDLGSLGLCLVVIRDQLREWSARPVKQSFERGEEAREIVGVTTPLWDTLQKRFALKAGQGGSHRPRRQSDALRESADCREGHPLVPFEREQLQQEQALGRRDFEPRETRKEYERNGGPGTLGEAHCEAGCDSAVDSTLRTHAKAW